MQKLSCILKILFNNDELIPRAKKIKTLHTPFNMWHYNFLSGQDTHTVFKQKEGKGINV